MKLLPAEWELLLGIFEEGLCPITRVQLARCGLTRLHMSKMDGALAAAKYLSYLDLSGMYGYELVLVYISLVSASRLFVY